MTRRGELARWLSDYVRGLSCAAYPVSEKRLCAAFRCGRPGLWLKQTDLIPVRGSSARRFHHPLSYGCPATIFRDVFAAIRAGAGRGILPCFIADEDPLLERVSPPVPETSAEYWLIVHRDLRRAACVRAIGSNPFSEANVNASPVFVVRQRCCEQSG